MGRQAIWTLARLIAPLALLGGVPTSAAGATSQINFQAIFVGDKPARIDVVDLKHPLTLTAPGLTDTSFTGVYSFDGSDSFLVSGRLLATYTDDTPSLAIRLWPGAPDVNVRFYRKTPSACDEAGLKVAERDPDSQEDAEESFFMARALYRLGDQCSAPMLKRAARAWFDRAYDLVTFANFFDLSDEAARAEAKFDAPHVRTYQDQSKGLGLVRAYEGQKSAIHSRNYGLAAALNQAIQDRFGTDDAALKNAHLTLSLLKQDAAYIQTFLSAQGSAPATTPTLEIEPVHPG